MKFLSKLNLSVLPVYPFLLGLYPVLYLWSANRAQQPAYVIIPSLLVTLVGLIIIYLISFFIQLNVHRAALLATVVSLYVLSYGHIYNLVNGLNESVEHSYLLPVSALLVFGLMILIVSRGFGSPQLTKALNVTAAALVLFQVVSAAPYYLTRARIDNEVAGRSTQAKLIPPTGNQQPQRDVYFILLDNYGRQDVLLEKANFDNSELVNALKERGFIFPDCAQTNYPATAPVISSILNMNYLDQLGIGEASYVKRGRYGDMAPLIQDSQVIQEFRDNGYHVVTFRGFMGLIDIQNTDTYISFEKDTAYSRRLETTNFQNLYFQTTVFQPLNDKYKVYPDYIASSGPSFLTRFLPQESPLEPQFDAVYRQNLYAYDALEKIPREIRSPKFVYAHIYSAHWPFIMRPDGSIRLPFTQKMTNPGYVDAVQFTNKRVLEAIDSILKNSKTEPVIILQGDHSNGWEGNVEWSGTDRMKILSAYYLPGGGDKLLRDDITPVNNFRLIFKHYFGKRIDLLPDVSRYLDPQTKTIKIAPKTCMSDVIK